MKIDVLTIGDAFEDVLVEPEELKVRPDSTFTSGLSASFELGEKLPLKNVDYEIGGSACNTAVGFSRLGIEASILTVLGADSVADKIKSRLIEESVDIANILSNKAIKSNFSIIFRLKEGRSIFIYHGLKEYSCFQVKKNVLPKWIFLGPTGNHADKLYIDLTALVAEKGARLAWNPGALQIREGASYFRGLLKNVSVIFLNREELIKFIKLPVHPSVEEAAKKLYLMGPKLIVITDGKKGAIAYDGKRFYNIDTLDVVRVDSTGAGDSFAVGFLGKLILEKTEELSPELIREALKWGIVNSNSVITKIGAQAGLLTAVELEKIAGSSRLKVST